MIDNAMKTESLSVVKWVKDTRYKWSKNLCKIAAVNGLLEVLEWLRETGCP